MSFIPIPAALADLAAGKMLVLVDDEDRENEGDLIFAAQFSSPEKINFTIKEARGVLCVALSPELAHKFDLPLMVRENSSNHETAFTITVDSARASTGVSAFERDETVRLFADPAATPASFVRPGHINPLIARPGGVLERTGHTEGVVDLCRLAGLTPACVICEIVRDDGEMARRADLRVFCQRHGLGMLSISELIKYRLEHESLIRLASSEDSALAGFRAKKYTFHDHLGATHIAFAFGEPRPCENVKFHLSGSDFELLTSEKFSTLLAQLDFLRREGGVIIFMQTPAGPRYGQQFKSYGIGAQILRFFKIEEIKLLSKSCDTEFIGLEGFGLNIKSCEC